MLRENQKSLEKYYIISVFSGIFQLPVFKSRPEVENMTMQNFKRFKSTRFSNLSKVPDIPEWGRPRFNRMGHRIKLKGVANGPGCQPIPGEDKTECRFCDAKFSDGRQAINHYMGKKHQVT